MEESYTEEDRRQRRESLWDTLLDHFARKKTLSFSEPLVDSRISEIVPDMDDITVEVRNCDYLFKILNLGYLRDYGSNIGFRKFEMFRKRKIMIFFFQVSMLKSQINVKNKVKVQS